MCFNVAIYSTIDKVEKKFSRSLNKPSLFSKYHFVSGFDHPWIPVISTSEPNQIKMMKWGLIPHWFSEYGNENNMANKTLNARCETLQEKKSFQVVSRNRCLVLINGFYEWNSSFGKKYPYYIQNETSEFLTLGGVWDSWLDQVGNEVQTFSIITTPANSQMETIHNTKKRMPLIIPEDRSNEWLSNFDVKKEIEPFLVPFQHNLKAYTVSSFINKPKNNRNIDKAHQNYNYPELDNPQLDLF